MAALSEPDDYPSAVEILFGDSPVGKSHDEIKYDTPNITHAKKDCDILLGNPSKDSPSTQYQELFTRAIGYLKENINEVIEGAIVAGDLEMLEAAYTALGGKHFRVNWPSAVRVAIINRRWCVFPWLVHKGVRFSGANYDAAKRLCAPEEVLEIISGNKVYTLS